MDQITFCETEYGKVRIEVRFEHENLSLSRKLMAELFKYSTDNISLHLKNIFKSFELDKNSVAEEYSATAVDDKKLKTNGIVGMMDMQALPILRLPNRQAPGNN